MYSFHFHGHQRILTEGSSKLDEICKEDQTFFLQNQDRSYRVRLASNTEVLRHEEAIGKTIACFGKHTWLFAVVRQLAPGARMRTYVLGSADMAPGDISEDAARELWDAEVKQNPSLRAQEKQFLTLLRASRADLKHRGRT